LVLQTDQPVTLSIAPAGVPPPAVQWYKDSALLWGATNTNFSIASLNLWDMGDYEVVLSNFVGTARKSVARLEVVGDWVSLANSRFDFGLEGWTAKATSGILTNLASGGNPGRCLGLLRAAQKLGATPVPWELQLPALFLGNKSLAYGGLLCFDLNQLPSGSGSQAARVILSGGGLSLAREIPKKTGTNWVTYRLVLHEYGGWRHEGNPGRVVTREDLLAVLSALSSVTIQSAAAVDARAGVLDNVELLAVSSLPDPLLRLELVPGPQLLLQWPASLKGFQLETTAQDDFSAWTNYRADGLTYEIQSNQYRALVPAAQPRQFFRLRKP
jgi:hypothetical protein